MNDEVAAKSVAVHAAAARLLRFARANDGRAGSGPAQTSALGALHEKGPMTVQDLARHEGVTQATMSRLLQSLVAAGAVAKSADPSDRRKQVVKLLPKGRRVFSSAHARRQKMIDVLISQLKPETVDDLLAALTQMARALPGQME